MTTQTPLALEFGDFALVLLGQLVAWSVASFVWFVETACERWRRSKFSKINLRLCRPASSIGNVMHDTLK
jgi:hypothetical protein